LLSTNSITSSREGRRLPVQDLSFTPERQESITARLNPAASNLATPSLSGGYHLLTPGPLESDPHPQSRVATEPTPNSLHTRLTKRCQGKHASSALNIQRGWSRNPPLPPSGSPGHLPTPSLLRPFFREPIRLGVAHVAGMSLDPLKRGRRPNLFPVRHLGPYRLDEILVLHNVVF
jgi:hypothetical protein